MGYPTFKLIVLDYCVETHWLKEYFGKEWYEKPLVMSVDPDLDYDNDIISLGEEISDRLKPDEIPIIVHGPGDYHHLTYGFCEVLAKQRAGKDGYVYVHVDRHTDDGWLEKSDSEEDQPLNCGCFVDYIKSRNKLLIGCEARCNYDKAARRMSEKLLISPSFGRYELIRRLKLKKAPAAYISIDLDVTEETVVMTDYERGRLTLRHILEIISQVSAHKRVVGADVLGLAKYNSTNKTTDEMIDRSMLCYDTIVRCIAGVPYGYPLEEHDKMWDIAVDAYGSFF